MTIDIACIKGSSAITMPDATKRAANRGTQQSRNQLVTDDTNAFNPGHSLSRLVQGVRLPRDCLKVTVLMKDMPIDRSTFWHPTHFR